jgi:hypothetical protein
MFYQFALYAQINIQYVQELLQIMCENKCRKYATFIINSNYKLDIDAGNDIIINSTCNIEEPIKIELAINNINSYNGASSILIGSSILQVELIIISLPASISNL